MTPPTCFSGDSMILLSHVSPPNANIGNDFIFSAAWSHFEFQLKNSVNLKSTFKHKYTVGVYTDCCSLELKIATLFELFSLLRPTFYNTQSALSAGNTAKPYSNTMPTLTHKRSRTHTHTHPGTN